MAIEATQTKTKKRRKTSPRQKLVKALDTIVSLLVRARDKKCVLCGTRERLTNGHLFSRVAYSTRWSLVNCNTQCIGCNLRHEYDPYPYQEWFKRKYGEETYHKLYQDFARVHKYSDSDLREMLEQMKIEYARYT